MKKCKYYTNINIYTIQILTKTKLAYLYCFKIFYLFIFRERGREGERQGKKHRCVVASRTGDPAHNAGMCPD